MKTWINKRRINLGATQAQIFKSIICNYYNNNFRSIDEYDFLLILSHTYQCFRSIRSTEAEEEIPLDTPLIKTFCNTEKRAAGFFPICDAQKDASSRILPRFLKKFSSNILDITTIQIFYRVSRIGLRDKINGAFYICSNNMFKTLSFKDKINTIIKPVKILCKKSLFWKLTIFEKLSTYKAVILFETNYKYFSKIASEYAKEYEAIYVSNFYSSENLGLIKAFLEVNLSVIDVQHGVQNNVAAYEYKEFIPKSISPSKFLCWFDFERFSINTHSFDCKYFDAAEEKLKYGSNQKILISLQPSNTDIFLEDLNLLNLKKHKVLIRLHPRRQNKQYKDRLKKLLDFEFDFDFEMEISKSLKVQDIHLTEYSSCVLDGLISGTPSICFHPIAREYFSNLEAEKKVRIYDSIVDFLNNV